MTSDERPKTVEAENPLVYLYEHTLIDLTLPELPFIQRAILEYVFKSECGVWYANRMGIETPPATYITKIHVGVKRPDTNRPFNYHHLFRHVHELVQMEYLRMARPEHEHNRSFVFINPLGVAVLKSNRARTE